ncbi:DegT/DnrJ/EryC1/StrS family aminotransferase [Polynucleobacter paneuropaeus]|nr:DegT/DnrJ/EryC1/StrS family aminotransferase [Polynucleobacter paneuropaeus]
MFNMIPVNEPLLDGNEKNYLIQCIESGWISSEGPFVSQFENEFASRFGRKYGIAVSNGTVAIEAAIEALGIQRGDEVIMPTFTIISCIAHLVRIGAVPVLIDSCSDTWNMDVSQIEERITSRTKAIMVVHIYGLPVDMNPLLEIAKKYGLKIIEDAAEMHGQTYNDIPCGSFGDISTFSFYSNKHITTGEGGMIVTNDAQLAEDCRGLRNLCFKANKRFVHDRLGWNMRMTNMQAAVGVAQLERLDEFVLRKRRMGSRYANMLSGLPALQLPLESTSYAKNIYWVFGIVISDDHELDAERAIALLAKKGIACRPFFCPMHEQPVLKNMGLFDEVSYPVAEKLYRKGLYVPSGMAISDEQMDVVVTAVHEVFS